MKGIVIITIVLQNRENLLGRVIDEQMVLNAAGEMVEKELLQLSNKHPECTIEHHVVMPNHIHFIKILNELWYVSHNDGLAKLRDEDYYLLLECVLDNKKHHKNYPTVDKKLSHEF